MVQYDQRFAQFLHLKYYRHYTIKLYCLKVKNINYAILTAPSPRIEYYRLPSERIINQLSLFAKENFWFAVTWFSATKYKHYSNNERRTQFRLVCTLLVYIKALAPVQLLQLVELLMSWCQLPQDLRLMTAGSSAVIC